MSEGQRYRVTFKCSCNRVFKKLTTNPNLESAPCPSCKKKDKKTKLFKIGDGPVPSTETKAEGYQATPAYPNTIYKCDDCFAIAKVVEDIGEKVLSSCPACDSPNIRFRGKISKDIASEAVMKNKCVDKTADIVMTDYGMTDLRDNVRVGESMAPKLPAQAQAMADQMIGGAKDGQMRAYDANTRKIISMPAKRNGAALAKRALSGSLRDPKSYVDPVAALHRAETRGRS